MSTAKRTGQDYRVVRRVSDAENRTLGEPGEDCRKVPAASIEGLLSIGAIEPADAPVRDEDDDA